MPGPFAFADPEYLQDVLVRSGYQQIHLRPLLMDLTVGSDLDSAMKFQTEVGPVSRVMTDLKGGRSGSSGERCERRIDALYHPIGGADVVLDMDCNRFKRR